MKLIVSVAKQVLLIASVVPLLLIGCSDVNNGVTSTDQAPGEKINPPTSPTIPPTAPSEPSAQSALVLPISSPMRMAGLDTDTLLISDTSSNAIHLVDKSTLEVERSIRFSGRATGIAHFNGLLFVGNKTTQSVDAIDLDGVVQFQLGSQGDFPQVNDLAVDESAGLVYVLDTELVAIKAFHATDGSYAGLTISGLPMIRPTALAVDQTDGRLLVSDYGPEPKVVVFDSNGAEIAADGFTGAVLGFSMPQGLFVDDHQNVYLAEARLGEVLVINADKVLVTSFGTRGIAEGELLYPLDVFVDSVTRDIFVADNQNSRITVFLGGGVVP